MQYLERQAKDFFNEALNYGKIFFLTTSKFHHRNNLNPKTPLYISRLHQVDRPLGHQQSRVASAAWPDESPETHDRSDQDG